MTMIFLRTEISSIAMRRAFLAEESACKGVEAEKCLSED